MAGQDTSGSANTSAGSIGDSIDLTCPVCFDTFNSPRFLPCHHSLCTACISDLMERAAPDSDAFLCPLCQAVVKVPEDGVTTFQVNFYLAPFLTGARGATKQARHGSAGVQGLKRTPESSPSNSFDLSCQAHWSGEWLYFCRTCATLVCRPSCQQHQGQDHSVVTVASEAPNQRSEIRRQLLSLTTFQGALADLEDECKHRVTALEDSCLQVVHKMDSTRQQACGSINFRADKSTEKVRGLKSRISRVVEGEMKTIQDKMTALSSLLTSANDVMAANDAEFLRQKTKLMARIQSVMSKVPPSRGNLQFSFKMSPDVQSLIRKESSFGYMTIQFQSPVLRHKMTLTSTKQQRKLRKLCPRGDGTMLASVGNCLVTIAADFSESRRLEFPGEVVDFLPARDGYVYVVLPFPNAVKRLNTSTDVAGDFVTPLSPPTCMACTDKRELVFASNDGKELCLTYYSESAVRLKRITIPKPDFCPLSMTITKQGRLFLCSSKEVMCLDSDFSDLATLANLEDLEPRCLTGLRGLGSGVGDVLVANWAAANVEIVELNHDKLTRKREIIQWKRGTSEEDVDFSKGLIQKISCAVLDQSGRLWVGQEDGHVTIYDWLLRAT